MLWSRQLLNHWRDFNQNECNYVISCSWARNWYKFIGSKVDVTENIFPKCGHKTATVVRRRLLSSFVFTRFLMPELADWSRPPSGAGLDIWSICLLNFTRSQKVQKWPSSPLYSCCFELQQFIGNLEHFLTQILYSSVNSTPRTKREAFAQSVWSTMETKDK